MGNDRNKWNNNGDCSLHGSDKKTQENHGLEADLEQGNKIFILRYGN